MAKIIFSLDELVEILIANDLIPENIKRIKVKDNVVHFVIKVQSFILPLIPASLSFLSFDDNKVTLELTFISSRLSKAIGRHNQLFDLKMPAYIKFEYPNVIVDMDKLLQEKNIRGIRVKEVLLKESEFTVVTDKG